ncbi:MAG: acyl-coenzyme A thioesterase PaaI-like protein [Gammaproteobacteria bacterium]|jgi:acyl-coenzyme A thioesterase PaaI-like protein
MAWDERARSWFNRTKFNLFPCFRRTGARIIEISPDERHIKIKLPLNWSTRGYFGTTFGGSIYAATDPVYMVMLNRALGRRYAAWDKAAQVRFMRPGRATLYASFDLSEQEIDDIKALLETEESIERSYQVEMVDGSGEVHAVIDKLVHVRHRKRKPGGGEKR